MHFDLTREPWVSVVGPEGVVDVSLRTALARAHELTALDRQDPLICAGMHRLLAALALEVLPALSSDQDWAAAWRRGRFERAQVEAYFDAHHSRFDLFDAIAPFYQVAGLEAGSGETKSVTAVLLEVATGNNVPLFSAVHEGNRLEVEPAEAARRLVAIHGWDTAAIKTGAKGDPAVSGGKTTGNPTGILGSLGLLIPQGRSLFETLLLSCPVGVVAGDLPVWRRSPDGPSWTSRETLGVRDLYTWQSRRVRLLADDGAAGRRVGRVLVCAGDRLVPSAHSPEPHTAWRRADGKDVRLARRPVRHHAGKAAWRGLDVLLSLDRDDTGPVSTTHLLKQAERMREGGVIGGRIDLLVVGVEYGNQSAVIENVVFDDLPLPLDALVDGNEDLREALTSLTVAAEEVMKALNSLDGHLRQALGAEPTPWDKGQRPGDRFIAGIATGARAVLAALSEDPDRYDEAVRSWQHYLHRAAWSIADPLLDEAPPAAFAGRPAAGSGPDKPAGRKGGDRGGAPLAVAEAFFRAALKRALPATIEVDATREVS